MAADSKVKCNAGTGGGHLAGVTPVLGIANERDFPVPSEPQLLRVAVDGN